MKHFKWEPRGKRRIHKKPNAARSPPAARGSTPRSAWSKPRVLVWLGATAAQALLGTKFRVANERGRWIESPLAPHVTATVHPSAILPPAEDSESRHKEMDAFVSDLKLVASVL